jgi:acrylyl-CoA reductase (NADPH)
MTDQFDAILISKTDDGPRGAMAKLSQADLPEGDVLVAVSHSTVNYKDGLAITGRAPIARRLPMVGGIDLAGKIVSSANPAFAPGDDVLVNGYGLSETHWGGYAGFARLKSEWLVRQPKEFTPAQCMAIGTAGYTAMLCVLGLESRGIGPDRGTILVTGAAGGVGSVAISLLAAKGYRVAASTGRVAEADYLTSLGAAEIIDRAEFSGSAKPLAKERFAGAIDSVGSTTLVNVLSQISYGGAVAACGLAQGMDLPGSVAPFILRGVDLLGIDSVMAPMAKRIAAWARLSSDLDIARLASMTKTISLSDVIAVAPEILGGQIRGRLVVDLALS